MTRLRKVLVWLAMWAVLIPVAFGSGILFGTLYLMSSWNQKS